MLPFYFKKIGFGILVLSVIILLFTFINPASYFDDTDTWGSVFKWTFIFGLVLTAVSKEKNETVEMEIIKFKCLFRAFFMTVLTIILASLSNLLLPGKEFSMARALDYLNENDAAKLIIICLAMHLILFGKRMKEMKKV